MNFVQDMQKGLFSQAMKDLASVEFDDLVDALDSHNVHIIPNKDKIISTLEQVANKQIFQAPAYVAECLQHVFHLYQILIET